MKTHQVEPGEENRSSLASKADLKKIVLCVLWVWKEILSYELLSNKKKINTQKIVSILSIKDINRRRIVFTRKMHIFNNSKKRC